MNPTMARIKEIIDWLNDYSYSSDPNAISLRCSYTAELAKLWTELELQISINID